MAEKIKQQNAKALFDEGQSARKKADTPTARKYKKYINLDLMPQGKDLHSYLVDVSSQMQISITAYIQELIKDDMERNEVEPISQKTRLLKLLDGLSDKELTALEILLNR